MANRTTQPRATKAERKEQARRERIELQRKMARTRRNRRIFVAIVAVVAVGATVFLLTRPEPVRASPGALLAAAEQATADAGCTEVEDIGPYEPRNIDRQHVPSEGTPPLSTYPTTPPASGPHNEITLGAGVYRSPPPIERMLHSLEHGAAIVWYAPGVADEELERLETFYEGAEGARVIVAPYDYPDQGEAGSLPAGSDMALVAWHRLQTCAQVSLPVAFSFTADYSAPPFGQRPYLGEAPEAGAAF
ncbi:MAG TPA: DUF3105 domain-containing protein [Actinomycetota bacterium]|jgi:hypothetical protein